MPLASFHEIQFPPRLALGASGGPSWRTEVLQLASGHDQRNLRWSSSRRRYDAGTGIRSLADLHEVVQFFEARAGRLFGFRFRDPLDHKSCPLADMPDPLDQPIGTGDGTTAAFALVKSAAGSALPPRRIAKPVGGTVRIAVAGEEADPAAFEVDYLSGTVSFSAAAVPAAGALVTAGFEFDVPVRFDTDEIRVSQVALRAGAIPSIPMVEILS